MLLPAQQIAKRFLALSIATLCSLLLATSLSAASARPPRYRLYVLKAPKGWDRLNLQGMTPSGMIYGTVQRGQGMNDIRSQPFTMKNGQITILPAVREKDDQGYEGTTIAIDSLASEGSVKLCEVTFTWDGTWSGSKKYAWATLGHFEGNLPEPQDRLDHDISNCWLAKDGTIYATVSRSDVPSLDEVFSHMNDRQVGVWKDGVLVRIIQNAQLIGIDSQGRVLITADKRLALLGKTSVTPLPEPPEVNYRYMTRTGHLVGEYGSNGQPAKCSINLGKRAKVLDFLPRDATMSGAVLGTKKDENWIDESAMLSDRGTWNLNSCVVNLPHGVTLTNAYFINIRNWIFAEMTDGPLDLAPSDFLLKPIYGCSRRGFSNMRLATFRSSARH